MYVRYPETAIPATVTTTSASRRRRSLTGRARRRGPLPRPARRFDAGSRLARRFQCLVDGRAEVARRQARRPEVDGQVEADREIEPGRSLNSELRRLRLDGRDLIGDLGALRVHLDLGRVEAGHLGQDLVDQRI